MKKLCYLIFLPLATQAQVSINRNEMPVADDSLFYATVNLTALTNQVNLNGQGATWNFNLNPLDTVLVEYERSSKTPYSFYFSNTTGLKVTDSIGFGQFSMKDVYQFYSTTNSAYKAEGMGFRFTAVPFPLAGMYSDEDEIYNFPLTYGRRDSTTYRISVTVPSFGTFVQKGYRITEVEGEGSLIMRQDTFDCIKLKSYVVQMDSVITPFASFGFPSRRYEYRWFSPDHNGPLAEVMGPEQSGNFVPAIVRYQNLDTPSTGPGVGFADPAVEQLSFYPNPASAKIFINDADEAEVTDMTGRTMKIVREADGLFSLRELPAGIYLLRTAMKGVVRTARLVIRHE